LFEFHQKWCLFLQLAAEKKTPFLVQLKKYLVFLSCQSFSSLGIFIFWNSQRSVNIERKFCCLQFFQKINLKILIFALAYWDRNFLFFFWKNLKTRKVLSKLTDLILSINRNSQFFFKRYDLETDSGTGEIQSEGSYPFPPNCGFIWKMFIFE
jgi:hypothetical protein